MKNNKIFNKILSAVLAAAMTFSVPVGVMGDEEAKTAEIAANAESDTETQVGGSAINNAQNKQEIIDEALNNAGSDGTASDGTSSGTSGETSGAASDEGSASSEVSSTEASSTETTPAAATAASAGENSSTESGAGTDSASDGTGISETTSSDTEAGGNSGSSAESSEDSSSADTKNISTDDAAAGTEADAADSGEKANVDSADSGEKANADAADYTADVETEEVWKASLPKELANGENPKNGKKVIEADYRSDIVAIAKSQLGVKESAKNYVIGEDGEKDYYNRYSAWYGENAYGEPWDLEFVEFVMYYAGIPEAAFDEADLDARIASTGILNLFDEKGQLIVPANPADSAALEKITGTGEEKLAYEKWLDQNAGVPYDADTIHWTWKLAKDERYETSGYEAKPGDVVFIKEEDGTFRTGIVIGHVKEYPDGLVVDGYRPDLMVDKIVVIGATVGEERDSVKKFKFETTDSRIYAYGRVVEEDKTKEQTIDATVYTSSKKNKTTTNAAISLKGELPVGGYAEAYPVKVEIPGQEVVAAFDITIYDRFGDTWQPEDQNSVSVSITGAAIDALKEDGAEAGEDSVSVDVYHMEDKEAEPEFVESVEANQGEVKFEAGQFSIYVVVYTVDFHWGDYTYSIAGEDSIKLSELFEKLDVTEIDIANVKNVSFSDEKLVKVEKIEASDAEGEQAGNDWLLTSLAAFDTEETLTLDLKNGESVEIKVTDDDYGTLIDSVTADHVTWTEYQDGSEYTLVITVEEGYTGVVPAIQNTTNKNGNRLADEVTRVILGEGITGFAGNDTFNGYKKLREVVPCSTLTSIPQSTFRKSSLQDFDFSKATGLVTIGKQAFSPSNLTSIDLSGLTNLTTIGESAWGMQYTSESAYSGTTKAATLDFSGCVALTTIGNTAFEGIKSNITTLDISQTKLTNLSKFNALTNLTVLTVEDCSEMTVADLQTYTKLKNLDLSGCTGLTSITNIPASIVSIDIAGCTNVTTLNVIDNTNLTTLDITGDTGLTTLHLPSSVTTLTGLASCTGLQTIYYSGTSAMWTANGFTVPTGVTLICADDAELEITAHNATKVYDGEALTLGNSLDNVDVEGFLMPGHTLQSIEISGSQTDVGSSVCTPLNAVIVDGSGNNVTERYTITYKSGTLEVTCKSVIVRAGGTKEYGDPDPDPTITGLVGDDTVTYTLSRSEGEDIGWYLVTVNGETEQGNYTVAFVNGNLEITRAPVTVTAVDKEIVQGEDEPALTATVTGLKNGEDESVISYTLTREDPDNEHSGTYVITTAGEKIQGNYTVSFVAGTLTINPLTIIFQYGNAVLRSGNLEMGDALGTAIDPPAYKSNNTFKGWFPEGSDTPVTARSVYQRDTDGRCGWLIDPYAATPEYVYSDTTLYAHFTYTVRFEAEGATLSETERVLDEGAQVGELPIPVKDGYRFDGWLKPDGTVVEETEVFDGHVTLTARFVEQITVTFNPDGAELAELSRKIDKGAAVGALPELTKENHVFRGWFTEAAGGEQVTAETTFDSDMTLYAHFAKLVNVTFVDEEKNTSVVKTVADDIPISSADFPTDPVGENCSFDAWYTDKTSWTGKVTAGATVFTDDTTVYARYTVTVTFIVKDSNGTVLFSNDVIITKGTSLGEEMPQTPVLSGYRFEGWFENLGETGETQISASTVFSAHTTVTAKFIRQVSIVFLSNGTRHEFVVDEGDTVTLIENPIKSGYRFDGWFIADSAGEPTGRRVTNSEGLVDEQGNTILDDHNHPVRVITATEDMTLAAKFIKQIDVEFIVVHPSTTSSSTGYPSLNSEAKFTIDQVEGGNTIPADFYDHIPVVSGYYFAGWYHVTKINDSTTGYTYADFTENGYFVTPNSVENGKVYALDESKPVYTRNDDGTGTLDPDNSKFTEDTILVAKLIKEVTITFRYQKEGDTQETVVKDRCLAGKLLSEYYGPLVAEGGAAYREGYRIEWIRDGAAVDDDYTIVADDDNAVFDARYIKQVTATFQDENGNPIQDVDGNIIQNITKDVNTAIGTLPTVPETNGTGDQQRQFMGWFDSSGRQYTDETILTDDVTLTAKYGYTVTFTVDSDDDGDFDENDWSYIRIVEPNAALGWMPAAPYKEGHSFKNWTLNNVDVDVSHVVTQNETIIGHYEDISIYTVTVNYVINGESEPTDTKIVSVDKSTVTAEHPYVIESPATFRKNNQNYYPVMTTLQIVPDDTTGLGIFNQHTDVTVAVDSGDAKKLTITVPYKQSDATYTIYHKLLKLNGNEAVDADYEVISGETETNVPGVIGAIVSPTVKDLAYAEYKKADTGEITQASGQTFSVYYTRKEFKLTYDTTASDVRISPDTAIYGTSVTLPTPTRTGYDFDGWYTEYNSSTGVYSGDHYNGGTDYTLMGETTLYAKWKVRSVNYAVVYLFEKFNDAGTASSFVYDSSETMQGDVGSIVYATDSSIPIKSREGYELDDTQNALSSVEVAADGSSVLFVYYKLIEFTFNFQPGTVGSGWNTNDVTASLYDESRTGNNNYSYTMTVKLGQDISASWPTASNITNASYSTGGPGGGTTSVNFYGWYPDNGENSVYVTKRLIVTEDMLPQLITTTTRTVISVAQNDNGSYVQDDNRGAGTWYTYYEFEGHLYRQRRTGGQDKNRTKYNLEFQTVTTYSYSTTTVLYTARWLTTANEYTVNYWFQNADDDAYTKSEQYSQTYYSNSGNLNPKDIAGYTYDHSANSGNTFNFYYNRDTFQIDYYYGSTNLRTIGNVKFGATITGSTYNWTPTAAQCGLADGFTFDGWYADSGLTTRYTFDVMPSSPLVLYAKWIPPVYTVTFYEDQDAYTAGTVFYTKDVEYNSFVGTVNNPTERENEEFEYWFNQTDNAQFFPGETPILKDTVVVGRWQAKEITRYRVQYLYTDNTGTHELLPEKVVYGRWHLGDEVTEIAPYVTGYTENEDETMIADSGEKKLTLSYDDAANLIVFNYDKKPDYIYYSVYYLLWDAHDLPVSEQKSETSYRVADPIIEKRVNGNYTSVTETAAMPTVEAYLNYRPTETTKTLSLGSVTANNVLIFYYNTGAKLTVEYLDMEGESIRASEEKYLDPGESYAPDLTLSGYTLDHIEKNGLTTTDTAFMVTSVTDEIAVKIYYKTNLILLAHSANKPYDGTPLELADSPSSITADGLKSGHTITAVTINGSQTNVGMSDSVIDPDSLVISGLAPGLSTSAFYNITCLPGMLTVTKINVIISVEPDRWTGNVYDGKYKATGFTNGSKSIADYVIISNEDFKSAYLEQLWTNLMTELKDNGRGYVEVPNALLKDKTTEQKTVTGLRILNERNAGDYYEESGIFLTAATAALSRLEASAGEAYRNYNVILYVRESRLEISPAPMTITTEGAEKPYDSTPLTNDAITVTVRGDEITPSGNSYTTAQDDTINITVTGSQLTPGESQNIYEIDWGTVNPENYNISETLGILKVTKRAITIKADDLIKAYDAEDPDFTVTVTYEADDGQGGTTTTEIPAILTHWSGDSYTLQLNDETHGFIENISLTITREAGETPGAYKITPATDNENFDITCVDGKLVIAIARVSNNNGATWNYHAYLMNDAYNSSADDACMQGALNYANSRTGDVVIETLCSTAKIADNDDRYAMDSGFAFGGSMDSVTLRTTQDSDFNSTGFRSSITRGFSGASLITTTVPLTLDDIIFDGQKGTYTGSIIGITGSSVTVGSDAVLRNAKAENGAAISMSSGTLTMNGTIRNCESTGSGGGVYMDGGTFNMNGSIQGCKSTGNGGAVYMGAGTLTMTGTIRNCESSNVGGAVYVGAGASMTMNGGTISGNSSENGGAIDVGASAMLTFAGNAVVYDNLSGGDQKNVVLSVDDDAIINASGIGSGAKIGVYVPDGETLFDKHGGVQDKFGKYTGSAANLGVFVNDRNGFTGKAAEGNYMIWSQTIRVEVRYIDPADEDYTTLPTRYTIMYRNNSYDPPADPSQINEIYDNLYNQYNDTWVNKTDEMVPWLAFLNNRDAQIDKNVIGVLSSGDTNGKWAYEIANTSGTTLAEGQTLILYYTKPAYDLEIQKVVKEDTAIEKTFDVTIRSTAIARERYIVVDEMGTKSTVWATPARNSTPGSFTVKVKGGSKITVKNLTKGEYTITEPTRKYSVTARTSTDSGNTFSALTVSGDDSHEMRLTHNADRVVEITNTRKKVDLTIQKTVRADDTSGSFAFVATVIDEDQPIGEGFTLYDNGTLSDTSDDLVTDREGKVAFTLSHNNSQTLTVPAGANVEITEDLTTAQAEQYAVFMTVPGSSKTTSGGSSDAFEFEEVYNAATLRVFNIPSICKVISQTGSLLYFLDNNGTTDDDSDDVYIPAVYSTIRDAFAGVGSFYTRSGSTYSLYDSGKSKPYQIQMLVDYDVPAADVVEVPAGYTMTFSTASRNARDGYPFRGTGDDDRAILKRAEAVDASFFKVSGDTETTTTFTLKDIVLDGSAYPVDMMGGAINAENSIVTIDHSKITNFNADNGGAVYTSGNSLTIKGDSSFVNCTSNKSGADVGGGAVQTAAVTILVDEAVFEQCTAKDQGGAILVINPAGNSSITVKNARFEGCKCKLANSVNGGGGAIHTRNAAKISMEDVTFNACTSASKGGAFFTWANELGMSNCAFINCEAVGEGGAFCHYNSTNNYTLSTPAEATMEGCTFISCKTTGQYGSGGALQSNAKIFHINNCEFTDCRVQATNADKQGGAVQHYSTPAGGELVITNSTFTRCSTTNRSGGAINANAKENVIENNTFVDCHSVNGGAIFAEDVSANVKIKSCSFTGCYGTNGGAINMRGGMIEDCTFNGCYAGNNGGAVYNRDTALTINGSTVIDGNESLPTGANGNNAKNGGGVYVAGGSVTISNNSTEIRDCAVSVTGGAIYVAAGKSVTLTGGTFKGNTAVTSGAGIYLTETAKLYISGAPVFGDGTEGKAANTVEMTGYSDKKNGNESAYGENKVRQDIYTTETVEKPASIVVTGDLTGSEGSIWVWAESAAHYQQLMPFAQLNTGVVFAESPTGSQLDSAHLKVFRNAQDDDTTENSTETWLFGTIEGDTAGYVYWSGVSGSRKVILRKVDSSCASVANKTFTIYKGTSSSAYQPKGETSPLSGLSSGDSTGAGCFWIGTLPYGWYIIKETDPQRYFYLVITEKGTYGTLDANNNNVVGGYDSRDAANTAAAAKYYELK